MELKLNHLNIISESKEWLYPYIGIHHASLLNCLPDGNLYIK